MRYIAFNGGIGLWELEGEVIQKLCATQEQKNKHSPLIETKKPTAQKQKFVSPSHIAPLRCQTLAFFTHPPHFIDGLAIYYDEPFHK